MGHKPIVIERLLIGALALAALSCWSCAPIPINPSPGSWHLDAIGAPEAWNVTRGEGEVIAILDSGLTDATLPSLRAREIGPRPAPDVIGHGTAVTTLAAGSGDLGVWGVAPLARVVSVSVLDDSGQISTDSVAAGIAAAVRLGASVINLSFGQASDDVQIKAAIDSATSKGIVIVAAGGDTGSPTALFPAGLVNEVIAVRAMQKNGKPLEYANRLGLNGVDAPGQNLTAVRVVNNVASVGASSGSSLATALVSGAVILLKACVHRRSEASLAMADIVRILRRSAGQGRWFNLRAALREAGC